MSVRALLKRAPLSPPAEFASAVLESLAEAVVACDADATVVMVNRRAREMLGLPAAPVPVGEWPRVYDLYDPEGPELVPTEELPLKRVLEGEEVGDLALEIRPKNGGRRVVSVSGGAIRDQHQEVRGAVLVMREVTGRPAMEEPLGLEHFIAPNVAEAIALVRAADGDIVYANERFEGLFGYERGELVGRHISVVNAPTEETPEQRAQEIVDGLEREGVWRGDVCTLRKDGSRFWCGATVSAFEHPDQGTVWVVVQREITEQKAAESALRDAEERFRAVFEESPTGIALVGNDFRLTDVNHVLCRITGYRRDELIGRRAADITHPDDVALDAGLAAQVFSGEIPRYRIEQRYVTKAGHVVPVTVTATLVRGSDGAPLYGIAIVEEADR
jgi:PAS domain S-box-containing protein